MNCFDCRHFQEQHVKTQKEEHGQGAERQEWDGIQRHHQGRDQGEWNRNGSKRIRQLIEGSLTAKEFGCRLYDCYTDCKPDHGE